MICLSLQCVNSVSRTRTVRRSTSRTRGHGSKRRGAANPRLMGDFFKHRLSRLLQKENVKLSFLVIQPNAPLTHRVATGDSIAVQGRKIFRNLLHRRQQTEVALSLSDGLFARSPLLRCRHFDLQERGKRRRTTEQIKFRPSSDRQTGPSSPRGEGEGRTKLFTDIRYPGEEGSR